MLMFNTVLFGVGTGMVIYAWLLQINASQLNHFFEPGIWTDSEKLLFATIAILLAGFFHSITVLYPAIRSREVERVKAANRASELENLAHMDALTGIYNRRFFDRALAAYLEEFAKTRAQFGLFLFDIDFFKTINDEHGHVTGDYVLKEVARSINELAREYDIVARIGGEEFAVIAPYASGKDLEAIGERYRTTIEKLALDLDGTELRTTISVGIASSANAKSAQSLFKAADTNLYQAKRTGRNRVVI